MFKEVLLACCWQSNGEIATVAGLSKEHADRSTAEPLRPQFSV